MLPSGASLIGPQETIWHLRAALNVAALACGDGKAITSAYNRFLADRKQVLKKAWAAETSQHGRATLDRHMRSEEHTSELQSLMRISYAVFCLKKKKKPTKETSTTLRNYYMHTTRTDTTQQTKTRK